MTLNHIFAISKETEQKEQKSDAIYSIPCNNCNQEYIGHTKRQFGTRLKEHQKTVPFQKRIILLCMSARAKKNNHHHTIQTAHFRFSATTTFTSKTKIQCTTTTTPSITTQSTFKFDEEHEKIPHHIQYVHERKAIKAYFSEHSHWKVCIKNKEKKITYNSSRTTLTKTSLVTSQIKTHHNHFTPRSPKAWNLKWITYFIHLDATVGLTIGKNGEFTCAWSHILTDPKTTFNFHTTFKG